MNSEALTVFALVGFIAAVFYAIIRGLWRGPRLPAIVLLSATILFSLAVMVDEASKNEPPPGYGMRLVIVCFPIAIGAYAHALRSRSGL